MSLPAMSTNTSSSSSSSEPVLSCAPQTFLTYAHGDRDDSVNVTGYDLEGEEEEEVKEREKQDGDQLSLLALLVTLFRKSLDACKSIDRRELCAMEIGWPTNVRHVAHVTFDRFNGFMGLPVEFEPEVPRRAPSASATVFGVSTESMQLSYDSRGNSVPTILLLMQRRLYAQGGLQAEGIFRINAENGQEEYVREQLNGGVVPEGIDVHCLAGLIKAWFRELPSGVLDSLSPEQVMQCQIEEHCAELARLLPPTESALLDWAINLMADVVQQEHLNKMNARNIAMVFAPNMTHMADPLTALMYAVQVMNFLKTLILRTLREREDSVVEPTMAFRLEPFDENGDQSPSLSHIPDTKKDNEEKELAFIAKEPLRESFRNYSQTNEMTDAEYHSPISTVNQLITDADLSDETSAGVETFFSETDAIVANYLKPGTLVKTGKSNIGQSSNSSLKKEPNKIYGQQSILHITNPVEKTKEISNLSRIGSRIERIEAWR
ncbi:rho GTPase-activating protein 1-like [Durio zibethinus]|uniref:Rho GTPase-activating protein 1-like n=1 Tax=Durio zibethinus TaxID=66656 RepID=A0A6P5XRP8_DURZI|nr:rho GTPase-activating protein 1-like [Durio zibethinus]